MADDAGDAGMRPQVGMQVECRAKNVDELFYQAVVTNVDEVKGTWSVLYQDGTRDEGIRISSMLVPSRQKMVFQDSAVTVVDGHVWLYGKVLPARFLAFNDSPQLYQSTSVLRNAAQDSQLSASFDFNALVFDVNQALALVIPLTNGVRSLVAEREQACGAQAQMARRICIIGAGAGCLAMCFRESDEQASIDAVEISAKVVEISHEWFGVPRNDEHLTIHNQDGLSFFSSDRGQYDVVVIDVAKEDTQGIAESDEPAQAIELPPEVFLSRDFLVDHVTAHLDPQGWVVVNVIAGRQALQKILDSFSSWFEHVYICAVDPNYAFFMSNVNVESPILPEQVVRWACEAGYHRTSFSVLQEVGATDKHLFSRTALGWFTVKDFQTLLEDMSVLL